MREWTPRLAKALKVVGLINIQYCVQDNKVRSLYCCSCSLYWEVCGAQVQRQSTA